MEHTSDPAAGITGNPLSVSTANRLLNLLELSKSDLTTFTGGEDLPVTETVRDTLLSVLAALRPDLLAHSQRVAFLCHGIARQCGWSPRKINTLVTAALLHEIGSVIVPTEFPFWELTSTEAEELSRRVSVDLLAACHADSELLEILTLSQNFRYREPLPVESELPTPSHVIMGAAAFNFANLFDAVRHRKNGQHDVAEILAALKTLAEIPEEHRVVESLEEWLSGRDSQIENYDVTLLQQQDLGMDEDTLNIVHATFLEILYELHELEENYQGFFILDSTGRFLLWNYGCQNRIGYSMREMRNKHWSNHLMGYCNEEGLAFSDSQTPLYQTLESAKPAHLTLCLKNSDGKLVETEVNSVPIMGRDGLLLGIVEVYRGFSDQQGNSKNELLLTPDWIGDLVDTIHDLDDDAEPIAEVPELDDSYLLAIEAKLEITELIAPPSTSENSVEAIFQQAAETVSNDSEEIDLEDGMVRPPEQIIDPENRTESSEQESDSDVLEESMEDYQSSELVDEELHEQTIEESDQLIPEPSDDSVEAISEQAEKTVSNDSEEIDLEDGMARPPEQIIDPENRTESPEEESDSDVLEESMEDYQSSELVDEELHEQTIKEPDQSISEPSDDSVEDESATAHSMERSNSENLDELFSRFDSLVSNDEPEIDRAAAEEIEESAPSEDSDEPSTDEVAESVEEAEDQTVESSDESDVLPRLEDEQPAESEAALESTSDVDPELWEQDVEPAETLSDEQPISIEQDPTEVVDEDASSVQEEISEQPVAEDSDAEKLEELPDDHLESESSPEETLETDEFQDEVVEELKSEAEATIEKSLDEELDSPADEVASVEPEPEQEPEIEPVDETEQEVLDSQTTVEDHSEIPATIEMPSETQPPETQEAPSPDPGQTDPLAQPVSRKEWDAFVEHLIDPVSPDYEEVSVLFLDVDHFKAINDGFGRQIGTDLLTEISRRLSQACGQRELSCRYGGGQFAIACPGINLEKARKRGDQFRKLIDRTRFDVLPFHSLTVSVGITSLEEGDNLTELMNRAEHGLYQAKQSGRNCSVGVSSADIKAEMKAVEAKMSKITTGEFDVETHFEAMVASDMIVYKLGGFLYDMHAKLLHVDRRHVSMRVGKKGLLPYWGRQDDDRPVIIDLELAENWNSQRSEKGLLTNTRINVKIRPDGWVRSQETFLKRAHFVLRELKGHFVSN